MKRESSLLVPVVLALLLGVLPLILGAQTLFLRDITYFHAAVKHVQAESFLTGIIPLIDPTRGGGQPMAGNPNAVTFYPDNLLFLVAPARWALNAHFWIHLLIAPFGMFWLARRWGLTVSGSAGAATFWATSGFVLSQMNFYNLIAGTALVPAFLAAALGLLEADPRAWRLPAVALLWSLLILGGDPILAAQAGLMLVVLVALRLSDSQRSLLPWRRLASIAVALLLGVVLALPQIVEFLRILPLSYRGHWGYDADTILQASLHPLALWEWLLPFAFGRPSFGFWGATIFDTAGAAFFWSLFAGVLALTCVLVSGVPRDRRRMGLWLLAALGIFIALGGFNPVVRALVSLPGLSLARYPVKFVLLVAVSASLLAGRGFERLAAGDSLRTFLRVAGALSVVYVATAGFSLQADGWLFGAILGVTENQERTQQILQNWLAMSVFLLVVLWAGAACLYLAKRRPFVGALLFLTLQASSQLFLLRPLLQMDDVSRYAQAPDFVAELAGRRVVHGESGAFGGESAHRQLPSGDLHWLARRNWGEGRHSAGAMAGVRYELNRSPEGLDSFLNRMALDALRVRGDQERVVLAHVLGAEVLIVDRPLSNDRLSLQQTVPSFGATLYVYNVLKPLPFAMLLGEIAKAPHLQAAVELMLEPDFDPLRSVVVPGEGAVEQGVSGRAELVEESAERWVLDVDSPEGGVLLLQRAFQPIYRATVDGEEAEPFAANLSRLGVRVPAGAHRVVVETDRRPLRRSLAVALLTLLTLPLVGRWSVGVLES